MIKFAIRDDDTSFWTNVEELELVYKEIWAKNIPISLAIIPFAVKSHFCGDRGNRFYQDKELKPVGENKGLIEFLKEKIKENKIYIMLHGYSHQYKVAESDKDRPFLASKENIDLLRQNQKRKELYWYGEYVWKGYEQLKSETKEGKKYLEDILHTKINVFVPPSNDISKEATDVVAGCKLNISGTIRLSKFNRSISICSCKNWLTRFFYRLRYDRVYPYIMDYGTHKELNAYELVPKVTLETLRNHLDFCLYKGAPFVMATHYWEMFEHSSQREIMKHFIKYVQNIKKMSFVSVNSLF